MKVKIEVDVSERVPASILSLLTEAAKLCKVDIWVVLPEDETIEEGYGHAV